MTWETIGVWIAAFLTLCLYSFLYKDNPFYKFAEHLFVGMSQGYWIVYSYFNGLWPYGIVPLQRATVGVDGEPAQPIEFIVLIPFLIGLLFFARFWAGKGWLTRLPLSFLFGAAAGIAIPLTLGSQIFQQMYATIEPYSKESARQLWPMVNLSIVLIGTLAALTYFFFSIEHKGSVGAVSRLGIWFLMVGFGSAFGNTVMNRVTLLIQRVEFLVNDWFTPHIIGLFMAPLGGG